MFDHISDQEFVRRRTDYAYPRVALRRGADGALEEDEFPTTRAMDAYIGGLLNSDDPSRIELGYLSVIFWGFYASADGQKNAGRAMSRARKARNALANRLPELVTTIAEAKILIGEGRYGDALHKITKLPGCQFAFASKVCAFLAPERCGVADSVVAENFPEFGFEADNKGILRNNRRNQARFDAYCRRLQEKAATLQGFTSWADRDGVAQQWPALDVERALYAG